MRTRVSSFQVGGQRFPGLGQVGPQVGSMIQRQRVEIRLWGNCGISIRYQHLASLGGDVQSEIVPGITLSEAVATLGGALPAMQPRQRCCAHQQQMGPQV